MKTWKWTISALTLMGMAVIGCAPKAEDPTTMGEPGGAAPVAEKVNLSFDGSSTVSPLMEAIAEEFQKKNPNVNITIAVSGTGGGFKKFAAKEIDIAMASRPIEEEEVAKAQASGIEFIEVPIGFDGLTVVINPSNDFASTLTVAELKKIWEPDSKINNWSQVRVGFPDLPMKLYGAGTDSGTFDYFTKAIVGKEKASRTDYQASEDDNTLVQGVTGDKGALGYFGYSYFQANQDKLKAVKVDDSNGGVGPDLTTIMDGTYKPLSRPLLIYIRKDSMEKNPAILNLISFLFNEADTVVKETGFVPLSASAKPIVEAHAKALRTGSVFQGAQVGLGIEEIMKREEAAAKPAVK